MEKSTIELAIRHFTLVQRRVLLSFKKEHLLNKTHVEILTFANTQPGFNVYQVHKTFSSMNVQQLRLGIRKLTSLEAIEIISHGKRNHPAMYMITKHGKRLLNYYTDYWLATLAQ